MYGMPDSYDAWKTACCDKWPFCKGCGEDDDDDDDDDEPRDPYEDYGSRDKYLQSLSEDYGVDLEIVESIAELLGPSEDFDGLVSAIEDLEDFR